MKFSMYRLKYCIFFILLFLLFTSCVENNYRWGWYELSPFNTSGINNILFLISGITSTLSVTVLSFVLSMILGFIIAFFSQLPILPLRWVCRVWVLLFRSIPVLVMFLWLYYGLAIAMGINLSSFVATIIGLTLCQSAFQSEVFRTGIESIPKSQIEASRVYGANIFQVYWYIIIPQMLRKILPTLANQFVYMLKISSVASVIGLNELTRKVSELTVVVYRPLEIYTFLIIEYLVMIFIFSYFIRIIEKKIDLQDHDI